MKKKYPWLFLKKSYLIDIVYDFTDSDTTSDIRELSAGQDTVDTAKKISSALQKMGQRTNLIPIKKDSMDKTLSNLRGDIVFNQVEEDELGYEVLLKLEALGKKVTGVDSVGSQVSWQKDKIKEKLVAAGIPTPSYFVVKHNDEPNEKDINYPLFVKAADDHGSLSITKNSLVKNKEALFKQVNWVKKTIGGDVLVEEYIDGRELMVGILGNGKNLVVLPIKEILFNQNTSGEPAIITYDTKWTETSKNYLKDLSTRCPAALTDLERKNIKEIVKKVSSILGVCDYARFDIRLRNNIPYIIDYNANPWIGSYGPYRLPYDVFGLTYPEFISSIVAVALGRYQKNI